jgi:hypothetical protein
VSELSQDELRSIVARDVSGYRLGAPASGTVKGPIGPAPDATTPDLDALRRKYLGPAVAAEPISKGPAALDDDTIVSVEPDAGEDGPGGVPKAVIVSNTERRVIGTQG